MTEISDKQFKENVKEVDSKKCIEMIKYIKPKTYNHIGKTRKCIGYIADDFKSKKMPDEWDNIVFDGDDGFLRMDYSKTTPILWSALQSLIKEVETLKKEISKLKGKGKGSK